MMLNEYDTFWQKKRGRRRRREGEMERKWRSNIV